MRMGFAMDPATNGHEAIAREEVHVNADRDAAMTMARVITDQCTAPWEAHGCPSAPPPVIDIRTALNLLAAAVEQRGADFVYDPIWADKPGYLTCRYATRGVPDCIVGLALAVANVGARELEAMKDGGVRELYLRGELPVTLTLGAVVVFEAAQQSQDRGYRWGDVLARAAEVGVKFLELMPDALFNVGNHSSGDASLRIA